MKLKRGAIIVIEGLDKSGKNVQTRILVKKMRDEGYDVESISFPDYSTPIGGEIKAFLHGKRRYPIQVIHILLVANRWEKVDNINKWLRQKKVIVLNRYSESNLVYGLARELNFNWLLNLERGLPKADLVIILDISPKTSLERSIKKDLYEKDLQFLREVKDNYLKMAERFGWTVINGEQPIEKVAEELWRVVSQFIVKLHQ